MSQDRSILITAADGQTALLTADLLLNDSSFSTTHKSLHLLAHDPTKLSAHKSSGATILPIDYDNLEVPSLTQSMKDSKVNTLLLIPPTHKNKVSITRQLIEAAKAAEIPNVVLLSSAGADLADKEKQPRLREFVELEVEVMRAKGETETQLGHSPVIVRAGMYAEALLLCQKQIQESGKLRLPIGERHKFAPVALGDVAVLLATILTSQGKHGLGDDVRGQLITLTGPQMCAGAELANAASSALSKAEGSKPLTFEAITPEDAKALLLKPEAAGGDDGLDLSELEYLLEFYSLVRDGRTNYVSTLAFKQATGLEPTLPEEFFKTYSMEFKVKDKKAAAPSREKRKKGVEPAEKGEEESPKKTKKVKKEVEVEVSVDDDDAAAAKKQREADAVKKAEKVGAAKEKALASKSRKEATTTSDDKKKTPTKPAAAREKTETATEDDDEEDYEMKDVDTEIAADEAKEEKELEDEIKVDKKAAVEKKKSEGGGGKSTATAEKGEKADVKKTPKKSGGGKK